MNINSKIKTGKFYLITVLSSTLNKLVAIVSKPLLLVRAALTGVATFSINSLSECMDKSYMHMCL